MKPRQSITKNRESIKLNNININNKLKSAPKSQKNQSENRIKKYFPLPPQPENYKEINFIYDNGKNQLVDYKNIIECDIYGSPKKKFINNITGTKSFTERLNKNLIKKLNYKKENYTPINSKFEGGFMFPHPLSLPFVSISDSPYTIVNEVKKEKRISDKKNIRIFSLKKPLEDTKSIPNYFCEQLGKNNPKDRKKLIKIIDNYITEQKSENKYEINFENKNGSIKALSHFKKKLKENMTNEIYNGKKIPQPRNIKNLKTNYQAIRKLFTQRILTGNKFTIDNLAHNIYSSYKKLFQSKEKEKTKNNSNKNFKELFLKKENNDNKAISISNEEIITNGNLKTIQTNETENSKNNFSDIHNNKIKMLRNYIKSNKNKNKKNKLKMGITSTSGFGKTSESFRNIICIKKKNKSVKEKIYSPTNLKAYLNTASNFNKNKDNKNLIDYDNVNKTKKNKNFKSLEEIKKNSNHENQLLNGFIPEEIKEIKLFYHHRRLDKDNAPFEHYKKDLELFKVVNKIAFEKEKKNNKFKDDLLKKLIQGKRTLESNKI